MRPFRPFPLLALLALPLAAAAAEPWTLSRAIATAREHSPDARSAHARIDAAEAMVTQANAAWLPQLSVSGRYTDTNSPMMAFGSILNQRAFNFGMDFNHPGTIDDLNATGTVAYNLYSGGRASAGRTAARAGADAAAYDLQATQNQLAAEVVKAALNIRKAREAVTAVEGGVRAYEAAVSSAQARFDAGQMLKADLLSLQVQLAQTREQLAAAKHAAALADRAFLFVLGLDPTDEPIQFIADDPALTSLAAPDTRDFSHRPELAGLQARVRAAEAMIDAARGGRRPNLNAFASYQYDRGWQLDRHGDSWMAGVSVDVNLFDGGTTSGKIRQAKAQLAEVQQMLRKAELGIGLEVEQARLAHDEAVERLAVTSQAVEQAQESANLSQARFEKQALLTADLIGVQSRLLEARLHRTVAAADERLALVDLRRALGLDPLPVEPEVAVPSPPPASAMRTPRSGSAIDVAGVADPGAGLTEAGYNARRSRLLRRWMFDVGRWTFSSVQPSSVPSMSELRDLCNSAIDVAGVADPGAGLTEAGYTPAPRPSATRPL